MLAIPEQNFQRSVNEVNIPINVLADWVEASVLFGKSEVSKSHVADALVDEEICSTQDMARRIADLAWAELRLRKRHVSTAPYEIKGDVITQTGKWDTDIARVFLIMLSIFPNYPEWAKGQRDVNQQGKLFEKLTTLALEQLFKTWEVHQAGWAPTAPKMISSIIEELKELLPCQGRTDLETLTGKQCKDAGLDIICFKQFGDEKEAIPIYMIQCASGDNWTSKLHEPNLNLWAKVLDYPINPSKAIAIPFSLEAIDLRRHSILVEGPLFDRNRILSASKIKRNWVSGELKRELKQWLKPRVKNLPWRI